MTLPTLALVTPAMASANNGNWQTAQRWARLLRDHYVVRLMAQWSDGDEALMIALHARRSAASAAAWHSRFGGRRPLVVVLTGTDLYRDIAEDVSAQTSLALAQRLVVLHEAGVQDLPAPCRHKAVVCLQSVKARPALIKTTRHLRALMVGHLREEKSPQTYFEAVRLLAQRPDIRLDHIGGPLDATLAAQAQALMQTHPNYRWLGALPHESTRRRIQAAHVLVHSSRMEGGAHVVIEAVSSGTPVLASRIPGNLGLLGTDYRGYFDWGDAKALVTLLERARDDAAMLPALQAQCAARAGRFQPAHERQTLLRLLADLQPHSLEDALERP
jgi:putative glycosyltransferase (TIGR04348 family)